MYFPFFKPQTGGKRFAAQPQTIYSEFPWISSCYHEHSGNASVPADFLRRDTVFLFPIAERIAAAYLSRYQPMLL